MWCHWWFCQPLFVVFLHQFIFHPHIMSLSQGLLKSGAVVWVIQDKYILKWLLFRAPESFQRTFPVQIDDVTLHSLNNTPASRVISQDHIESANRLSLANNTVHETQIVRVLWKEHSPVFWARAMLIFLREYTLFYFTNIFIITNFPHIKCTSKNSFGIPAACLTQYR